MRYTMVEHPPSCNRRDGTTQPFSYKGPEKLCALALRRKQKQYLFDPQILGAAVTNDSLFGYLYG